MFAFKVITSVVDGQKPDGTPNIVNHVLLDSDFDVSATLGVLTGQIEGPASKNLTGTLIPIGLELGGVGRQGYFYISPEQQSIMPIHSRWTNAMTSLRRCNTCVHVVA